MTVINKKVKHATPIVYDSIRFKSKLEVACYKALKDGEVPFTYEGVTFLLLPSFIYEGGDIYEAKRRVMARGYQYKKSSKRIRRMTWTPDFSGYYDGGDGDMWIIETKGRANDAFPLRIKMFKWLVNEEGWHIDLFIPHNKRQVKESIEIIKSKEEELIYR